jgi:protein NRD1
MPQHPAAAPYPPVSMQNGTQAAQPGVMPYPQAVNNAAPPAQAPQYANNVQAPPPPPPASDQNNTAAPQNGQMALNDDVTQKLKLLQELSKVLPADQLAAVIQQMGFQIPAPAAAPAALPTQQVVSQPPTQAGAYEGQNGDYQSRNDQDYQSRFREQRSRSPDAKRRRVTPPNRRESPTYGVYDPNVTQSEPARGAGFDRRDRGRGRGNRNEYRKRSPPRDRPASPGMVARTMQQKPTGAPKPIGHDPRMPVGRIKVLSRTLFIGGVKYVSRVPLEQADS